MQVKSRPLDLKGSEDLHGPAWRAAELYGCDMDLLSESLSLSPAERLRLHGIALRRVVTIGDRTCRVLGLDALIRAKEAAGRPRDQETVVQLKAIRERTS
jgi:hypothetical protein